MKKIIATIFFAWFTTTATMAAPTDVVCGPWISDVSQTSFTVKWITEGETLSWVECGQYDGSTFYSSEKKRYYQTYAGKRVTGCKHTVKIDGLSPGTEYIYRICGKRILEGSDAYNMKYGCERVLKSDFKVKTLNHQSKTCTFAMVNDIHGREDLFSDLTKDIKPSDIDFLLVNGDIISEVYDMEQVIVKSVRPVQNLVANVPYLYARGNHEGRGHECYRMGELFQERSGGWYFTFRQGPVAFIVLDTGEDKPDTDVEYGGLCEYDQYRNEQLEWLKNAVKEPEIAFAPITICIMHIPAYKDETSWYSQAWANEYFVPILKEASVDLMLSGHLHEHLYVPSGKAGMPFPVLCNSNEERLMVNADNNNIIINVLTRDGLVRETYKIAPTR